MALEIFIPATDSEILNLTSIEIAFTENSNEELGESFIDELISLATKYENGISSLTFKEN